VYAVVKHCPIVTLPDIVVPALIVGTGTPVVKLEYIAATLFAPGATVVHVDVLFNVVPLRVTLKISSSLADVAEDAA
jgi:hypothetical protein